MKTWVDHRLDGYASQRWTDAQVSRASGETLAWVLERWRRAAPRFAQLEDDPVMGPPARWAFGDAIVHEADISGAIQASRVPSDAVLLSLKGSVSRWRETLWEASAPTLLLRAPDARAWWLGVRDDPMAVVVKAPASSCSEPSLGGEVRHRFGRGSGLEARTHSWTSVCPIRFNGQMGMLLIEASRSAPVRDCNSRRSTDIWHQQVHERRRQGRLGRWQRPTNSGLPVERSMSS